MGKRAADVVGTTGVRSPQPKAHKATSSEEAASGAAAIDQAAHDKAVMEAAAAAAAEPKPEVPKVQDNKKIRKRQPTTKILKTRYGSRLQLDARSRSFSIFSFLAGKVVLG